jgi:hypothetical protein
MRKVFVEPVVLPEPRFRDGLGIRYVRTEGTDDPVEVLRPLWDVGSMQNAIRQRVGRLASFRQARFVPVRAAEVPRDDASTIEVVSDYVSGHRLSQYLEASHVGTVSIETSTTIYILREVLGALALLHESRGVTHGAVGPERILVTPKGRVVVADYVLGPAIERLEFTRPRLWREFRIPLPAGKGVAKLDDKADVVQVGVTALALLLGRPIDIAEYPGELDELLATLNQTQRAAGKPPLPAAIVGWVKRAVLKDPNGKFASVSDARMSLEAVISKQDAASGGAAALKALAETFGRYAAVQEARAAAAAAEEARKAAQAAQMVSVEAIRAANADTEAAEPAANLVPAFTLLSESPVPGAEADPPVGWRVPESPPVEETLPTSPLIQIDTPADVPAEAEFVEEVLDLTDLTDSEDAVLVETAEALAAEAVGGPAEQAETQPPVAEVGSAEGVVEVIVDLRELNAADGGAEHTESIAPSVEPASVEPAPALLAMEESEAAAAVRNAAPPAEPIETAGAVDAALAALAALEAPAPETHPAALPEWRLLADPVGAGAPTIDVEEPTETLDELVAEFAAPADVTPAVVAAMPEPAVDQPSLEMELSAIVAEPPAANVESPAPLIEPPVAMVEARVPFMEVPAEFSVAVAPQVPDEAPSAARASVLDEIVGLQEAQATAQAAAEVRQEPPAVEPDIAAWSFVEELMHHDARYEAPGESEEMPPTVEADLPCQLSPTAPGLVQTSRVETPDGRESSPAVFPDASEDVFLDARRDAAEVEAEAMPGEVVPAVEDAVPLLPTNWFIEVGPRPEVQTPVLPSRAEFTEPLFARGPEEPVALPPPSFGDDVAGPAPSLPPPAKRPALPDPVEELSGPVFPRVAPSVQRVRAEARRRRVARIGASLGEVVHAFASACARAFSGASRGIVAGVRAVLGGMLLAATAVSRGMGGVIRATAAGTVSVLRATAAGASAVIRSAGAAGAMAVRAARGVISAAASGAARGLRATASTLTASAEVAAKAAVALMRAGGSAISVSARVLATGLGALGRGGATATVATVRRTAAASAAVARAAGRSAVHITSAASAAGGLARRAAALAGKSVGRAAVTVPRTLYFVASDLADRLPTPRVRPWHLAAALVVIVAVAGVPYAKSWWFTVKPAVGTIRVESARPDAVVTIDGVSHGRAPVAASVPAGRHRVEIASAGRTRTHEVEVAADRETVVQAAGADLKGIGSIRVTTDPAGAEVLVDGVLHGRSPLTIDNLAEGTHTLLVRDASGSVRRTVRVRADEATDATLQIRPGWLAVFAPVKLELFENGRAIGSTEGGRVLSAPGPHTIELVSQAMGFRETRQVDIKPGEVAAVTIQMPPATIEIVAPAEAEILVDGQSVGQAPLGPIKIAVGTREIVMRHSELGERRQVISVTYNGPARVVFE